MDAYCSLLKTHDHGIAVLTPFGAAAQMKAVLVAVAANFTAPAKQIAAAFQLKTGDAVVLSFGSSGQFYSEITQGAPFEVFLSADAKHPKKLESGGLTVPGTLFPYAVGKSGSEWIVPDPYYSPIVQDAVLLKDGANDPASEAGMMLNRYEIA
ncbi:molybdate ABC transporter substrate-binding protein [Acidocella sp.]|uniref:molybdate ABC transporter substrate-binding protein n=1 Tax=Acidocella sp. TaxID=50710 RepID=UPI0026152C7E|nr:molybdate ABC transporter substrate-binding protein [Acidocella sp.]